MTDAKSFTPQQEAAVGAQSLHADAVGVSGDAMPVSYAMAAPLNETELTALLMASPLYKKLEQIRKAVSEGGVKSGHKPAPGKKKY